MSPECWQQIEMLYRLVRERKAAERPALLDAVCLEDSNLRRETEALLDADSASASEHATLTKSAKR